MTLRKTLLGAIAALILFGLALGARSLIVGIGRQTAAAEIPSLPSTEGLNTITQFLLREADQALRRDPASPEALGRMAMLYHSYQFYDQARNLYLLLKDAQPDSFRWPYCLGVVEEARGEWQIAIEMYAHAASIDTKDPECRARLASLLVKVGRLDDAKEAAQEALAKDRTHPIAAAVRARMEAKLQNWSEVVRILSPVVLRHPRSSECHKLLARAWAELGDREEAQRHERSGAYGEEFDPPILEEIYRLSLPALLDGDPVRGSRLVEEKCRTCHTLERTEQHPGESKLWWAGTVRRMQRLAGRTLLTDEEAADIVSFLASDGHGVERASAKAR